MENAWKKLFNGLNIQFNICMKLLKFIEGWKESTNQKVEQCC